MSEDRPGVYEVVSAPGERRVLVTAGPHGRGTLDRPGKWIVEATPFPQALSRGWYRRDLDGDAALALAETVIAAVEAGWWPGNGEPDLYAEVPFPSE